METLRTVVLAGFGQIYLPQYNRNTRRGPRHSEKLTWTDTINVAGNVTPLWGRDIACPASK